MKLRYFQKGFNFSQDGPGNRLVYHLQGCNLKCPWCANPEGLNPKGILLTGDVLNPNYCPKGAVNQNTLNRSLCENCSAPCTAVPASGIKLSYIEEEVQDIVTYCKTCQMMFFDGGGVTVSGGEPTLQFEAVREFFTLLKQEGVSTAMECNATHPRLCEFFDLVDFLITDCKHYNSKRHKEVCGLGTEQIFQNIQKAATQRKQLLVRIPLIGGFNASTKDAEQFARLFSKIGSDHVSYEFLRYHEYGKEKYKHCGYDYTMDKSAQVPPERIGEFGEIFKKYSLNTIHT